MTLEISNHMACVGPSITTPEDVLLWVQSNANRIEKDDGQMWFEIATQIAPELCGFAMVAMAAQNHS